VKAARRRQRAGRAWLRSGRQPARRFRASSRDRNPSADLKSAPHELGNDKSGGQAAEDLQWSTQNVNAADDSEALDRPPDPPQGGVSALAATIGITVAVAMMSTTQSARPTASTTPAVHAAKRSPRAQASTTRTRPLICLPLPTHACGDGSRRASRRDHREQPEPDRLHHGDAPPDNSIAATG
jgi:hypothetical protein